MTKPTEPYSRVYWRIVDDERFASIYGNDAHLAAWLRLLLVADQAWPASANVPASARRGSVAALVGCGLIELRPGGLFRVHGMDAERGKRQSVAVTAASARWSDPDPDSTANGTGEHPPSNANGMPRARSEPSRAEESQGKPSLGVNGAEADAFTDYYSLTVRYPKGRTDEWLRELVGEFGDREVGRALAAEWGTSKELKTFLSRTEARLRQDAHAAERARAKPKPQPPMSAAQLAKAEEQRLAIVAELSRVKDVP